MQLMIHKCLFIVILYFLILQAIPECIAPYCLTGDDLLVVSRHRIVVCTCSSAGALYGLKLNPGHFTHAFVDEVQIVLILGISLQTFDYGA